MTPYEALKDTLLKIDVDVEQDHFVSEARWLETERSIEDSAGRGELAPDELLQLRQLLDELRLEHDLRMNPGTLGS
jgi:hypothetical protein